MAQFKVYWYEKQKAQKSAPLTKNLKVDAVVVGGGMAGLTCAHLLNTQGLQTALLEKDFCGSGASGKSSGFITPDSELELGALIRSYGQAKAKRLWEFVVSGVEDIARNIEKFNINCDYLVQDSLFVANNKSGLKHVYGEHQARQQLSYQSRLYSQEQLGEVLGSDGYLAGVRYPQTFGINGFAFCQSFKKILQNTGVKVYESTPATNIGQNRVQAGSQTIEAQYVIVCADRYIPDFGRLQKEIYHGQTFLSITKPLSQVQLTKIFPRDKMMTWDTDLIYQYYRITGDNRLLLGGADLFYTYAAMEKMHPKRILKKLTKYLQKKFPGLNAEIEFLWPGLIGITKDLLPLAGEDKNLKNVFFIGAGAGLPWAAALARYVSDKISSGREDFDQDFSPQRKFPIGPKLQSLLTTPGSFAIANGIAKYLK